MCLCGSNFFNVVILTETPGCYSGGNHLVLLSILLTLASLLSGADFAGTLLLVTITVFFKEDFPVVFFLPIDMI